MTPGLVVIAPGLATTVQDAGRFGWQRQGVPVSGALDRIALAAANVVVGNAAETAALEMLYQGAQVEAAADRIRVAVAGCGAVLSVTDTDGAVQRIGSGESVSLTRGMRAAVSIGGPGIVAYLAVEGGIAVPEILGSRATYLRARLGGLDGRLLKAGDVLPLAGLPANRPERRLALPPFTPSPIARVVLGPQADYFAADVIKSFLTAEWTVRPASDRMGLRLQGPTLSAVRGHDIASDGIAAGAIQVPGDGQPIVLLADRQTTGGYPKIATVISADIPGVGRLAPGMKLRFQDVSVGEAEMIRRRQEQEMAGWPNKLVMSGPGEIDVTRLLSANLIDGVVDAHGPSVET